MVLLSAAVLEDRPGDGDDRYSVSEMFYYCSQKEVVHSRGFYCIEFGAAHMVSHQRRVTEDRYTQAVSAP